MRPLYDSDAEPETHFEEGSPHVGLWFDKFCDRWNQLAERDGDGWGMGDEGKREWLDAIASGPGDNSLIGDRSQIRRSVERRQNLVDSRHGRRWTYTSESRFVTGLGRRHPVENGFAWHPTLGTPYLPGSSLKGLLRNWASEWREIDEEVRHRIFGHPPPEEGRDPEETQVGSIIFLDAIPTGTVTLEVDVMTPHYGPWYREEADAPGDWFDPTPIPFLVVESGTTFQFAVMPRHRSGEHVGEDLERVETWLDDALTWLGAGAKTAVGYGRFE